MITAPIFNFDPKFHKWGIFSSRHWIFGAKSFRQEEIFLSVKIEASLHNMSLWLCSLHKLRYELYGCIDVKTADMRQELYGLG